MKAFTLDNCVHDMAMLITNSVKNGMTSIKHFNIKKYNVSEYGIHLLYLHRMTVYMLKV